MIVYFLIHFKTSSNIIITNKGSKIYNSETKVAQESRTTKMTSIYSEVIYSILKREWSNSDFVELIQLNIHDEMSSDGNDICCNQIGDCGHQPVQDKKLIVICKHVLRIEIVGYIILFHQTNFPKN